MLCPVCKNVALEDKELELGLNGHNCGQCGGNWVRFSDYEQWKKRKVTPEGAVECNSDFVLEYDNKKANFCPDCGHMLIKYKVSSRLPFHVDHCGSCNGLWMDRCEWESIVGDNLYNHVNDFFTKPWQEKIHAEMTMQRFEEIYLRKFGEEDYRKLKETRQWLDSNRFRGEMLAFLIDDDPFKI